MSGTDQDLESQINALLGQTDGAATDAPAATPETPSQPPAADDAADLESDNDITGMALAEDIQRMLDEASADAEAVTTTPTEAAAETAPAADGNAAETELLPEPEPEPAPPPEPATPEDAEAALVAAIDDMLSEQADDAVLEDGVSGEFQTIDQVMGSRMAEESAEQAPEEPIAPDAATGADAVATEGLAEAAATTEPAAADSDANEELEGTFETIDEALSEAAEEAVAAGDADNAEATTDDGIAGAIETVEEVLGEDADAAVSDEPTETPANEEQAVEAEPEPAPAPAEALSPSAAAVAEELDADTDGASAVISDTADDDADVTAPVDAFDPEDESAEASDKPGLLAAAMQRLDAYVEPLSKILDPVNRPFTKMSPNLRGTLGWIGLANTGLALGLLFYALFLKG